MQVSGIIILSIESTSRTREMTAFANEYF